MVRGLAFTSIKGDKENPAAQARAAVEGEAEASGCLQEAAMGAGSSQSSPSQSWRGISRAFGVVR